MAELSENIKQLNIKLQQLLKQHQHVVAQNEQQAKTILQLTETAEQQRNSLDIMKQEQLILKASIDKMDETEKKQLEKKINSYIRNIDKCISLLSHKQII
ncbi:MAG: hypothetical protein LH615_02705 [Ferruginibacter sp.]|nr:hypothetical protein [Ferruginibacter sp.]